MTSKTHIKYLCSSCCVVLCHCRFALYKCRATCSSIWQSRSLSVSGRERIKRSTWGRVVVVVDRGYTMVGTHTLQVPLQTPSSANLKPAHLVVRFPHPLHRAHACGVVYKQDRWMWLWFRSLCVLNSVHMTCILPCCDHGGRSGGLCCSSGQLLIESKCLHTLNNNLISNGKRITHVLHNGETESKTDF